MFNVGDVVVRSEKHFDSYWKRTCKDVNVPLDVECIVKSESDDTISFKLGHWENLTVYKHKFELAQPLSLENE